MSANANIMQQIKALSSKVIPDYGELILFGSQARADARVDSDWDMLVVLDKDHLTNDDYDNITYPFTLLGWEMDAAINPVMYTKREWESYKYTDFYQNVQKDGIWLKGVSPAHKVSISD